MSAKGMSELIRLAALNNAQWCNRICRAHGTPGRFTDKVWLTAEEAPPYYPNIVTLAAVPAIDEAIAGVSQALDGGSFAIKDSFRSLDLKPTGAELIFEAEWILRQQDGPIGPPAPLEWRRVESEADFTAWVLGWSRGDAIGLEIFPSALLTDPTVVFVGGFRRGEVVAGAALNRSEGVLGWSNVFLPDEDRERHLNGLIDLARRFADGRPLVGYERDNALRESVMAGFKVIGGLRVWIYPER